VLQVSLFVIGLYKMQSQKILVISLSLCSINLFAQGGYGILGYRVSELKSPISLEFIEPGFDSYWGPDVIESVSMDKEAIVLGLGYQWINFEKKYFGDANPISILYINMDFNSFDYNGYDEYTYSTYEENGTISNIDWSIGSGYGLKFNNGLSLSTNLEYTFTGVDDWDFALPAENYFSINLKIGFGKKTSLGHLGIYGAHYPNRHFINSSGAQITSNEIITEIPIVIYGGAILIAGAVSAIASGEDVSDLIPSSSGGGGRGCHVYGKIKFVDYGEDYKVNFVNYGEDLKIKYVSYLADSPGEWQMVEYGEDYKIKIVDYGEDFKVKEVSYGAGCK